MKKFYSDYDRVKMSRIKDLLDDAGIPCFVKNEYLQGASGEVPPHETLPEIWLTDDSWRDKAQRLVEKMESDLAKYTGEDWVCSSCNEENEGQFMMCWQCQQERPVLAD